MDEEEGEEEEGEEEEVRTTKQHPCLPHYHKTTPKLPRARHHDSTAASPRLSGAGGVCLQEEDEGRQGATVGGRRSAPARESTHGVAEPLGLEGLLP